jgi:Protein of unknown function (DUF1064).
MLSRSGAKISGVQRKKPPTSKSRKGRSKDEFQSLAEEIYYHHYIQPLILQGKLESVNMHETFQIVEAVQWGKIKLAAKVYTPDFVIRFLDGKIKVIEIKGTKVKKLQRDYPLRRQLFLLKYCIPNDWEFEEVKAETLTQKM